MTFWDRFVLNLNACLIDTPTPQRATAVRIVEAAHQREHFRPKNLNHLSILLLIALRPGGELRHDIEEQLCTRQLDRSPKRIVQWLELSRPIPIRPLVDLGRTWTPEMRATVALALDRSDSEVRVNLALYLARLHFVDPEDHDHADLVRRCLLNVVNRYWKLPDDEDDLLVLLYQRALWREIPRETALPRSLPSDRWVSRVNQDERDFLHRCTGLDAGNRVLLFMHVYGGLNVDQLAAVHRLFWDDFSPENIAQLLEQTWLMVL